MSMNMPAAASASADAAPPRPRLAFYGDDFTGSTDTLATVVSAGLRAALFLDVPTADDLAHFGPLDCVGVAGTARSMSPAEMDEALPRVFRGLAATGADVLHYKTCSTFDSAPHIGSIGHALRLAWRALGKRPAYIVGGQPNLGRYCSFGHLYARAGQDGLVYRLDRHPTMSRHPVTPMDESDLRLHLARQGLDGVASFDIAMLEEDANTAARRLDALLGQGAPAVLFDVTRSADLSRVGALLRYRLDVEGASLLVVGPTGAPQAWLATEGRAAGAAALARKVDQTFIVAGSRSPVTAAQIVAAELAGFVSIPLDAPAMAAGDVAYTAGLTERIVIALQAGRSVVAHSTLGDDSGARRPGFTSALARACGRLMADVLQRHPLARAGFAGGDTSSLAVQSWGARALTFSYTPHPGVAVCRVHAPGHTADGMELMLKGGQMGAPALFADLLAGAE
ncbi:Type III effector [Bordetella sputigena]|uniref:four-carbon acid sugar kinase family protein n=1 Tax=Bordetella sputigena TaxID=1416810 RepID=UPI0039F0D8DE